MSEASCEHIESDGGGAGSELRGDAAGALNLLSHVDVDNGLI